MRSILQCPICGQQLDRTETDYRCSNNHTFDLARQGYVNLLLSHEKHSKEPGDSVGMVQSRRRFLAKGFYKQVALTISHVVAELLPLTSREKEFNILDAGSGEGYYLKNLKDVIEKEGQRLNLNYYGVDISKAAVRYATQHDKSIIWVVGSIMKLPFPESSVDIVENIFAPSNFSEFSRVLVKGGKLILVYPGPNHLRSLRGTIYSEIIEHNSEDLLRLSETYFSLSKTVSVTYDLELDDNGSIKDMLMMTPFYWNINLETRQRVEALQSLKLEVDVRISVFEKRSLTHSSEKARP